MIATSAHIMTTAYMRQCGDEPADAFVVDLHVSDGSVHSWGCPTLADALDIAISKIARARIVWHCADGEGPDVARALNAIGTLH